MKKTRLFSRNRTAIPMVSLMVLWACTMNAQMTTYNINRSFNGTDTIQPFNTNTYSFGVCIDGTGVLLSDTAFIRVVLVDYYDNEWLVYERNSLYATEADTSFQGAAFETYILDSIRPQSVIVTARGAQLYLANIKNSLARPGRSSLSALSDSVFLAKNLQVVERINEKLSAAKKAWRADTTFLSNLRYSDRKAVFGNELPNLKGWDYFAYGYYSPLDDNTPPASNNIVKEFDWRTRHGSQNIDSYYYNSDGSGWIPRWRYGQVCAECWAFTVQYAVEAMVNLYFNRQLNDELSVQDILSCSGAGTWCSGGHVYAALDYVAISGIVNNSCFPYHSCQTIQCTEKCPNPNELVSISGRSNVLVGEEVIKQQLITKGVLAAVVNNWGHAMCMVGFGVVRAGDPILYGNYHGSTDQDIYVSEDSPDIGKPYYIFKQSYATYGYDNTHFCNIILDANYDLLPHPFPYNHYLFVYSIDTPITSQLYDDTDIACLDVDGDGYYNWGIGPKPANCPSCPSDEDSDDSSPLIGPYNSKYESVFLCNNYHYSSVPEHIAVNTTWGSEKYLDHNVMVEDGATLTIKTTTFLGDSTKIIVKPGGKLILDHRSLLTGMCGSQWSGIEVWGDSTLHQQQVNGAYLQGYLEIRSGAVIENAVCAVNLQNPLDATTTGGIVRAKGAVFRNNAKALHVGHYSYHDPVSGNEASYNAWFRNCTFTIDQDYVGDTAFHSHVSLDGANGVAFYGCGFSADRSVDSVSTRCCGIDAYNARFSVNEYCNSAIRPCPEEATARSSFSGFHKGINAVGDGLQVTMPMVYNSDFTANDIGVYCRATGFAIMVGNTVAMGDDADCSIGLYANGVTGLTVEENDFHTPAGNSANTDTYGAVVIDSRTASDIYRNSFSDLSYGNLAIGQNAVVTYSGGTPSATSGLTYTCNDNSGNMVDFHIADTRGTYSGIQPTQGSPSTPAGNTFSGSSYHIYNGGDYQITYYYAPIIAGGQVPSPSKLRGVTATSATGSHSCQSHYGEQPSKGPDDGLAVLEADFAEADSAFNALRALYASRIDGGDTHAETAAVNAANADNAPALKAQMLTLSPYLSRQVLLAAAGRSDVLAAADLYDILWANPDELGRDTLLKHIESLGVLTNGMMEALRQRAGATTERTDLEASMASYAYDRTLAMGAMVRVLASDTVVDNAALRGVLARFGTPDTDRLVVTGLMAEHDTVSAFALAEALPGRYGLTGRDLEDHNDYMRLLMLHRDLIRTGRPATELDAGELEVVEKIAGQGTGTTRAMAETLLERGGGSHSMDFCPTEYVIENRNGTEGKGGWTGLKETGRASGMSVRVSPVPATGSVTVDYVLPDGCSHATLELANTLGVKVLSVELEGCRGNKAIDLRNVSQGFYLYTVRCGDRVATGKLVVAK